jgi:hypothetical protein
MNTFGVERRLSRPSWLGVRADLRRPLLIALLACAGFIVAFTVARVSRPDADRGEAAPSLPVARVSTAIPARLAVVQPLESTLEPPAPRPKPAPQRAVPRSAPAAPAAAAPAGESSSAPAAQSSEATSPAPAAAAPAVETPPPAAAPRSSSSGGSSGHSPSTSSGGSFESSG